MKQDLRHELYEQAKRWMLEAGENIRNNIHNPLTVETKSNANDLVTTVDRETEAFFARHIRKTYPHHRLLSEEGYGDTIDSLEGIVWIVDPIDGTMNFVTQKRNFAISIGIYADGIGEIGLIYDVMADVLYHAKRGEGAYKNEFRLPALTGGMQLENAVISLAAVWLCDNPFIDKGKMERLAKDVRGTRNYGSAALEFSLVAEGVLDGYLTMDLSPWDIAAGVIIVDEAGGMTTDMYGNPPTMLQNQSILTAHHDISRTILKDYLPAQA